MSDKRPRTSRAGMSGELDVRQPARRWVRLAWLPILLLVAMVSVEQAQSAPHGDETGKRPVLFLGNDSLPPMSSVQGGKPAGIVVDLARAIAERLPSRVDIRLMSWAQAQHLVLEDQADALLQINPSPERLRLYDFSDPLLTSEFAIFIPVGRMGITCKDDLRELRVGVEEKGLPFLLLRQDPRIEVRAVANIVQAFRMLATGAVDAVVADRWVGSYVLAENRLEGVRVVPEPIERNDSAIAVKKGNTNLLRQVNAALADIRSDGTYDRIVGSWRSKEVVFKTREQLRRQALLNAAMAAALVAALASVAALAWAVRRRRRAESALRESEARFRLIFDQSPVGKVIADRDFRIVRANDAFCRFIDYSPGELKAMTFAECTHPDDLARELAAGESLTSPGGTGFEMDKRYVRKDGQVVWAHLVVDAIRDPAGEPLYYVGLVQDITGRKRAEEDLERMRNMLTESERIAHLGSFEYLADTRTTVWSEEEFRIYGLDPASQSPTYEVMLARHIHPGDAARLHETFTKALQNGSVYELEHRIVRPDGSVRVVYDRAHPYFDENGKLVRYVGATLDVTERRAAEEALRESEARFRLALKSSPVVIAMQDANLVYRWAHNTRTRRAEEVIGKTDADIFAPEDMPSILEAKRKALQTGEVVRHAHWLTSNGQRVFLDCYYEPIKDPAGRIIGVGVAAVNLTEQKQAEEALHERMEELRKLNEELTRFTNVAVGRELRMIELKKEINALCAAAGQPPRYVVHEEEPA
jgi:PAS domain S-box-containing protein